jgi:hypothetical protein
MAIGDRVKIGDGSTWDDSVTVAVYEPITRGDGYYVIESSGGVQLQRLGGVKGGTLGTVAGPSIQANRLSLLGEERTPTMGGNDLVHLLPIRFDYYQRVAFIPTKNLRIIGGGHGMNMSD